MPSFESHRIRPLVGALIVSTCVAAPGRGFSQTTLEPTANGEAQERIFESIAAAESRAGDRSSELIGPLTALALHYTEQKDYDLALAAVDQALHVVRVNFGLYSLEQAELLRLSSRLELARGNYAAAERFMQELLALARRNPDDVQTIPIFRELAALSGGRTGLQLRSEAIDVLLRNEPSATDELETLEMELVRASYHSVAGGDTRRLVRGNAYEIGRDSLQRLAGYREAKAQPSFTRVDALLAMADWDLLFKEKASALEMYEEAYELLKQGGAEQSAIERIFAPTLPVVLPAFELNPLFTNESNFGSTGYVDVAFEISKYGVASSIDVLDSSNEFVKARVVYWLRHSRFRPRVVGDEIAHSAPVVARYHVNF